MLEGLRVLVVDDEELICELVSAYLNDEGCQVESTRTGAGALLALQQDDLDLVLLDVLLPDESGLRLAARARERGIRVILMSGNPAYMLSLGQAIYPSLCKPFRMDELLSLIRAVAGSIGGGDGRAGPIHPRLAGVRTTGVDARVKPGHDDG